MGKWVNVVGFEGLYKASADGFIRTVARFYKSGNPLKNMWLPCKIMATKKDKDGYLTVGLRKNGIRYSKRVSRIICEAFHKNPGNKPNVNHKNGVKEDNSTKNLEWCTQSENILHAYAILNKKPNTNMKGKIGKLSPFAKPLYQTDKDGNLIKEWDGVGDAERAGFSRSRIKAVMNGKQEYHRGFKWSR